MNKTFFGFNFNDKWEDYYFLDMEMSPSQSIPIHVGSTDSTLSLKKTIVWDFNKKVEYRKIDEHFLPSTDQNEHK